MTDKADRETESKVRFGNIFNRWAEQHGVAGANSGMVQAFAWYWYTEGRTWAQREACGELRQMADDLQPKDF